MISKVISILGLALTLAVAHTATAQNAEIRTYDIPLTVGQARTPVLLLDGQWDFKFTLADRWRDIDVPGEAAMQGYAIAHDKPFVYRKTFSLPADYTGKRIILRFDGVYSHARLSVNGHCIRTHTGGFSRWETDITAWARPGKRNVITLEVTDPLQDISYASGYAHHPVGGILRSVRVFALPEDCFYDAYIETDLDSLYRDARLRFNCTFEGRTDATELELQLAEKADAAPAIISRRFSVAQGKNMLELPVSNPKKWDAEHPNLYALTAILRKRGVIVGTFRWQVGFRTITVDGDRLIVNGKPVKLRGACRHDMHPRLGRTTTAALDSLDVMLFKEANMNFVRTSHYPPSERFVELCDRYGIYVEAESAVCFVNTYRQKNYAPGATQDDSAYTAHYMGQLQEMVKSFRSHPAVLMWSIGNESVYGLNFQKSWDWVKATDRTRPVIFSYPGSVGDRTGIYDILSMHYQDVNGNLSQWGMTTHNFQGHGIPVLFDEWAHPACYTYTTLQNDPGIREFWGQSLDRMWSGLFAARGGLGGAIWGYIDETFALPEPKMGKPYWKEFAQTAKPEGFRGNCVGYGDWGIVDVWRRKKPEFWSTKKAYSPVRLIGTDAATFSAGLPVHIQVLNRFDHTVLNEIQASYIYRGKRRYINLPAVAPHDKGLISLPADDWCDGEAVRIEFATAEGQLIDAYELMPGKVTPKLPRATADGPLMTVETDSMFCVRGDGFEVPLSKATGLIMQAKGRGGQTLIGKGPFLNAHINFNHLTGAEVRKTANSYQVQETDWQKTGMDLEQHDGAVVVHVKGRYKTVDVAYDLRITAAGELTVDYVADGVPNGYLRESGLMFHLPDDFKSLSWERRGYWDCYPEGELSGNRGEVPLYNDHVPAYGEDPKQPWPMDTHDYYYWADAGAPCDRPLTMAAKAMKENAYHYTLSAGKTALSVVSAEASVSCRMNKVEDNTLRLYVDNRWDYPEIAWGNYCKGVEARPCYGQVRLILK